MYKYEFAHIIECESKSDDEIQSVIGNVRELIAGLGGRIIKEDVWGKKELAYPIKDQNNGYYLFTIMMLEGAKLAELEKKMSLLEGSLRYLIINLDKEPGYAQQLRANEENKDKIKDEKDKAKTDAKEEDDVEAKAEVKAKTVAAAKVEPELAESSEEPVETKAVIKEKKVKPAKKKVVVEETKESKEDKDKLLDEKLKDIL